MTEWFLADDPGYLRWLAGHPDGYVLNTWARPTAGYLVLHRARCGSINRQLPVGVEWTRLYGKACAMTRAELSDWSQAKAGAEPADCRRCLAPGSLAAGGSRKTAQIHVAAETFIGEPIRVTVKRLDGGPDLVIEGAQWLAERFFRLDPSAVGALSYDASTLTTVKDRFADADITTLNRTMAARTGHSRWADLLGVDPSPVLTALPHDWDLIRAPDTSPTAAVGAAIDAMRAPYRDIAVVTKMLHLKRPALVPVLDSLVLQQLGARGRTTVAIVTHVQAVGIANLPALEAIAADLSATHGDGGSPIERSLVRILDALLWSTHPASVLYPLLGKWRSTIGPHGDTA